MGRSTGHTFIPFHFPHLRMEETTVQRRVRRGQLNGVQLQARNGRAQFAARDKKIKNEVVRYRDTQPGQRHRLHFLKSIQNLLSKTSFNENRGAAGGGQ
ncbi:hypothetical protein AAVH_29438 [Aphelenchoides avenae]|nr:hypothetical protein AAVH_29438 [Aphelenchus avenae]